MTLATHRGELYSYCDSSISSNAFYILTSLKQTLALDHLSLVDVLCRGGNFISHESSCPAGSPFVLEFSETDTRSALQGCGQQHARLSIYGKV